MFQSTPLREGRLSETRLTPITYCFNPRPCVRGDGSYKENRFLDKFQSTPLREGRRFW